MVENKDDGVRYAAVLVRGLVGIKKDIKDALFMLRLRKKHTCAVFSLTPEIKGALQKCKDYITFGPVDDSIVAELRKVRRPVHEGSITVFNLAPPKGGFERGGIKKSFNQGGVLGFRKEIGSLLKKMVG